MGTSGLWPMSQKHSASLDLRTASEVQEQDEENGDSLMGPSPRV